MPRRGYTILLTAISILGLILFGLRSPSLMRFFGDDQSFASFVNTFGKPLHSRLALMEQVAHYKFLHQLPISDPEREKAILDRIDLQFASFPHLSATETRRFFELLMQLSREIQETFFHRFANNPPDPGLQVDLLSIRIRIDQLNQELLHGLAFNQPLEVSKDYQVWREQELRYLIELGVSKRTAVEFMDTLTKVLSSDF
jgi:chorismate mutase-like protein